MELFHDKLSSARNVLHKYTLQSHWVKHGTCMWGNQIGAPLRSSFRRISCVEHTWLTASSCCTLRSIVVFISRPHFPTLLPVNDWTQRGSENQVILSKHDIPIWGNFCLRNTHWTGWDFFKWFCYLRFFLPNSPSPLFLHRCQIFTVVWRLSKTTSAPSPLFFTGVSSIKPLAHLVSLWCLLLGGPKLT